MKQVVHYQELEGRLVQLLSSNTLHWRHQEMGVGMLLSMITYDHTSSLNTTQLWLSLLVSDQRALRLMAYQVKIIDSIKPISPVPVELKAIFSSFQALGDILKLCKVPSAKVPLDRLVSNIAKLGVSKPGVRETGET